MTTATTAKEAYDRYIQFADDGRLTQSQWHAEVNGRHLACGLGVIGDDVTGASKCPASVMPRWLAQMVPWLFDAMEPKDAFAWGRSFYAELARLDGNVPFSVIYDWQGNYACALGIEAAKLRKRDTAPHVALQAMHLAALTGEKFDRDTWHKALKNAYAYAYADADAYAAYAYATAAAANANAANAYAYKTAIKRLAGGLVECLSRALVIKAVQVAS